jgi:hypothetical protein
MTHRPRRAFLIVMLIPVVVVIAVAGYVFAQSVTDDPQPTATAEATEEPTAVVETASPDASGATPIPESTEPPSGSLTDLMQYAPDRLGDGSLPLPEVATYTDIESWLATQGAAPDSLNEDQAAQLAMPSILASRGLDPVWEATYGFSLADVDQVLAIGQAPDYILIMRGDFNAEDLNAAWASSAYQAVVVEDTTVWSLFPEMGETISLSNPSSQPAMGSLNNVVMLEDGTLIATARLSRLQQVLKVVAGDAPAMGDNDDVSRLLSLESADRTFVSAVIAKGELLHTAATDTRSPGSVASGQADTRATATPGVDVMPRVRMCLFGMLIERDARPTATPIASPAATPAAPAMLPLTIAISLEDADDIPVAIEVIESRFAREVSLVTGEPYASTYTMTAAESTDPEGLIVLRIEPTSGTLDWIALIADRDFGFLTWADDDDS